VSEKFSQSIQSSCWKDWRHLAEQRLENWQTIAL